MTSIQATLPDVVFNASDIKTKMSTIFSSAIKAPIGICRYGTENFVLMTNEQYNHFEAMEDTYWVKRAEKAMKTGKLVGTDKAEKILLDMLKNA
jgi:PHD/YefM family antitoxin component YafN of YafNO toxin-antitoxin module